MRVKLLGNHSAYHCGCAAVWSVLTQALEADGHIIVGTEDDFDILIVNGEGSMHHGRPTFNKKMVALSQALSSGRRALLVNTVWDHNPSDYDEILAGLDKIIVRETLSQQNLRHRHHVNADLCLDFSYFANIDETAPASDYSGAAIRTDFYDEDLGNFKQSEDGNLSHLPVICMKKYSWSGFVRSLQTTSLLVTGRHHAVYGACKARTPFAAIEGNSHKIRGLIATSGFDIPIGSAEGDFPALIEWARQNLDTYLRFFDWMEKFAKNVTPATLLNNHLSQ